MTLAAFFDWLALSICFLMGIVAGFCIGVEFGSSRTFKESFKLEDFKERGPRK